MSFVFWYKRVDPKEEIRVGLGEIEKMIYQIDFDVKLESNAQMKDAKMMELDAKNSRLHLLKPVAKRILASKQRQLLMLREREELEKLKDVMKQAQFTIDKATALRSVVRGIGIAARSIASPTFQRTLYEMQYNLDRMQTAKETVSDKMSDAMDTINEDLDEEGEINETEEMKTIIQSVLDKAGLDVAASIPSTPGSDITYIIKEVPDVDLAVLEERLRRL